MRFHWTSFAQGVWTGAFIVPVALALSTGYELEWWFGVGMFITGACVWWLPILKHETKGY